MRDDNGITLIELVITLAVLAICISIAMPSMRVLIERHHAYAATSSLISHMAQTRMAAITHRQPAVMCPSMDGTSCTSDRDWSRGWMLFLDPDGNRMHSPGETIIRADLNPTSRHLTISSSTGRTSLRYLPDGRATGTNLTISICNFHNELLGSVVVNNAGRPRSTSPNSNTPCPG